MIKIAWIWLMNFFVFKTVGSTWSKQLIYVGIH